MGMLIGLINGHAFVLFCLIGLINGLHLYCFV